MVTLTKLTVKSIEDGKLSVCEVGNYGLQAIQFIGNSTHRLTYADKTVVFIKTNEFMSEGNEHD